MNKTLITACVLSALAGAAAVRVLWQKETIKTVTQTETIVKDRVVTVTHEVIRPDGTKEVDTRSTGTTVTKEDKHEAKTSEISSNNPTWRVSGGVDADRRYIGIVQHRLLGPVSVGVLGDSSGRVGAVIGWEF